MNVVFTYAIFVLSCLMVSCSGQNQLLYSDIDKLERGMSKRQVDSILPISTSYEFPLVDKSMHCQLELYPFVVYERTTVSGGPDRTTSSYTLVSDVVVLLYENERLQYWGFGPDFKKCEDDRIAALGVRITQISKSNKW